MLASALALATAVALGVPGASPLGHLAPATLRAGRPPVDLVAHLRAPAPGAGGALRLDGDRAPASAQPPVCSGDVCQPAVALPGYEPRYDKWNRNEVVAQLLARANLEPLATIAWAIASTGLYVDYTPPVLDGSNGAARGWGSFMVRVRLRLDAHDVPVFPRRPR